MALRLIVEIIDEQYSSHDLCEGVIESLRD